MSSRPISRRVQPTALAILLLTTALVGCGSVPPPSYEWRPDDAKAKGVDPAVASPGASVEIKTIVGEHFFSAVAASDSSGLTVGKKEDWSFPDPVPPPGVLEQLDYRFDELSLLRAAEHKADQSDLEKRSALWIVIPTAAILVFAAMFASLSI